MTMLDKTQHTIKIDRGIPVAPDKRGRAVGRSKYPFSAMKPGDSFLFPKAIKNASSRAHHAKRATGYNFVTRSTPEGIRCWRVK
jgi:hypothetical protein